MTALRKAIDTTALVWGTPRSVRRCHAGSSVALTRSYACHSGFRVDRTYDVRNRIKTLRFPDGRGNQDLGLHARWAAAKKGSKKGSE